jgi:hypothetical protein
MRQYNAATLIHMHISYVMHDACVTVKRHWNIPVFHTVATYAPTCDFGLVLGIQFLDSLGIESRVLGLCWAVCNVLHTSQTLVLPAFSSSSSLLERALFTV